MVNPVSSLASAAVARRTSGSPVTAAGARGPRDWARRPGTGAARASRPPAGATKTSDFTIWPSSAPTAAAASSAVWVDSAKTWTSRSTPLRDAASITRWIGGGAAASRARPAGYTTGPVSRAAGRGTIGPMTHRRGDLRRRRQGCPHPRGRRRRRARRARHWTRAWPGWSDGVTRIVAADGGLVRARATRPASRTCSWATWTRLPRASRPPRRRLAWRSCVPALDKDESDTELALLEAVRRGAARVTILGAFGRAAARPRAGQPVAPRPPRARAVSRWSLLDAAARGSRSSSAPAAGGGPVTRALPGPVGATVSLLPVGGDATGVTTHGLRYPLRDEPLLVGPARGLSNVRTAADAAVTLRTGRLLVVEAPIATAGSILRCMSMPQAGDPAPEVALPDEHGDRPPPGGPRGHLDHRVLLPRGRHARLHDRGLRVPRPPRRARRSRTRPSGGSVPTAPAATQRSEPSSASRSPSSRTRTTRSPRPGAPGARSTTTARRRWA